MLPDMQSWEASTGKKECSVEITNSKVTEVEMQWKTKQYGIVREGMIEVERC